MRFFGCTEFSECEPAIILSSRIPKASEGFLTLVDLYICINLDFYMHNRVQLKSVVQYRWRAIESKLRFAFGARLQARLEPAGGTDGVARLGVRRLRGGGERPALGLRGRLGPRRGEALYHFALGTIHYSEMNQALLLGSTLCDTLV